MSAVTYLLRGEAADVLRRVDAGASLPAELKATLDRLVASGLVVEEGLLSSAQIGRRRFGQGVAAVGAVAGAMAFRLPAAAAATSGSIDPSPAPAPSPGAGGNPAPPPPPSPTTTPPSSTTTRPRSG